MRGAVESDADSNYSSDDCPTERELQARLQRLEQRRIIREALDIEKAARTYRKHPDEPTIIEREARLRRVEAKRAYREALRIEEEEYEKRKVARAAEALAHKQSSRGVRSEAKIHGSEPNRDGRRTSRRDSRSLSTSPPPSSTSSYQSSGKRDRDKDLSRPSTSLKRAEELNDVDFMRMDRKGRLPGEPGYRDPNKRKDSVVDESEDDTIGNSESVHDSSLSTGESALERSSQSSSSSKSTIGLPGPGPGTLSIMTSQYYRPNGISSHRSNINGASSSSSPNRPLTSSSKTQSMPSKPRHSHSQSPPPSHTNTSSSKSNNANIPPYSLQLTTTQRPTCKWAQPVNIPPRVGATTPPNTSVPTIVKNPLERFNTEKLTSITPTPPSKIESGKKVDVLRRWLSSSKKEDKIREDMESDQIQTALKSKKDS